MKHKLILLTSKVAGTIKKHIANRKKKLRVRCMTPSK